MQNKQLEEIVRENIAKDNCKDGWGGGGETRC